MNGQILPRIKVEYRLKTGEITTLTSGPIFDTKHSNSSTVDLLIDENDTNNYYIDFEIRKSNPCLTPNWHVVRMLKRSYNKFYYENDKNINAIYGIG